MKKPSSSREFVQRLDLLDVEGPIDADEAAGTLESFGLNAEGLVKEAMGLVAAFEHEQRDDRLAKARARRLQEVANLGKRASVTLDDAAIRQQLEQLSMRPGGEQLHFKNLKSCSREELEALLDEFAYLEEEDGSGKG